MVKLIATKSLFYATRRMKADDPFTARSEADARALIAIGKARRATGEPEAKKDAKHDIVKLRADYSKAFGKKPFNGWDSATLLHKISEKR